MSNNNQLSLDIVSKHRAQLYGFAAIWVVLSHGVSFNWINLYQFGSFGVLLAKFFNYGNIGVDMFLFLSGISLYFSWHNKQDINRYIKRRLERILIPYLVIVAPVCVLRFLILEFNPHLFIGNLSTIGFWVEGMRWACWYVPAILMFYVIYPYIYAYLFSKDKHICTRYFILLVVSYYVWYAFATYNPGYYWTIEIVLGRMPVFVTGCFFGKYVYEKRQVSGIWWVVFVASLVFGFWSSEHLFNNSMYFRGGYAFVGVGLSYCLAWVVSKISQCKNKLVNSIDKFYVHVGSVSFELYLSHVMINRMIEYAEDTYSYAIPSWLWIGLMVVAVLYSFWIRDRITIFVRNRLAK